MNTEARFPKTEDRVVLREHFGKREALFLLLCDLEKPVQNSEYSHVDANSQDARRLQSIPFPQTGKPSHLAVTPV
jgi:hypothetical protein